MAATMLSTAKTNIDFAALVTRSATERLTVKHLAREFKMKSPDMKKALDWLKFARNASPRLKSV